MIRPTPRSSCKAMSCFIQIFLRRTALLLFIFSFLAHRGLGQDQTNAQQLSVYTSLANSISDKALLYSDKIESLQKSSLKGIEEAEQKLFRHIRVSPEVFSKDASIESVESMLNKKLKNLNDKLVPLSARSYLPKVDSMFTSLKFLTQNNQLSSSYLNLPLENLEALQQKIGQLQALQDVIAERKVLIESKLRSLGKLGKDFQKYNTAVSGYKSRFEALKADLDKPDKLVTQVLSLLAQRKEFRQFFAKHSIMAGFVRLPVEGEPIDPKVLEGLQTRKEIEKILTDRFGSTDVIPGVSGKGTPMPGMQSYLASLGETRGMKELLRENELLSSKRISPKEKRKFKDMLHWGVNIQTVRATGIFPTTTDIGLSLGMDFTDRLTGGIGMAGKLGLGQNIQNIKISGQGLSLRSFVDGRIKGGIYLTASAEMNYLTEITKVDQLKDLSAWKFAGLAGLTKKFQLNQRAQANIQILYDFFYRANGIQTQPLVFRFGYSF